MQEVTEEDDRRKKELRKKKKKNKGKEAKEGIQILQLKTVIRADYVSTLYSFLQISILFLYIPEFFFSGLPFLPFYLNHAACLHLTFILSIFFFIILAIFSLFSFSFFIPVICHHLLEAPPKFLIFL